MSHEVSQVGSEGSKHASNQASNAGTTPQFRAAQYVRMSTEHQQHSTHNQADRIQEYADRRGIQIVRT
tara:strand:- start:435 stop:638 length:204 start_codon:yes stop_codon:yes gene_type:complete